MPCRSPTLPDSGGIPCNVVMPRTAPQAKKDAVRGYGGEIIECEPSTSSREAEFAKLVERTGAEFVHPYNDPRVIAGQATCSLELLDQVDGLDAVVAPIGGGGMCSGTCLTLSNKAPEMKIYAAEPVDADDAMRSLKAGHIIADDAPDTIADGLKVPLKGIHLAFRLALRHRHPYRHRAGNHRRDAAHLATHEDRDRAFLRRASGNHPEESRRGSPISVSASSSPGAMSISTSCPGTTTEQEEREQHADSHREGV